MGMFSCYYLALVGTLPTRAECEKFGGCKKCSFYLEEPSPESIVYTGQAKTSTITTTCDDMRVKKEERGVVVTSEDLKLVFSGELPKESEDSQ